MACASLRTILPAQDWAATPLGPYDRWPVHLRSTLNLCLDARYPLAIYWGPDLVLLYNDEWRPILGNKHPWAIGRPAREVWAEIWDIIGPVFQHVFVTGEGTRSSDQLLPMLRHGYVEECYFDWTFSPIRGDDGRVDGIFNAVTETTYRVLAERRARVLRDVSERTSAARTAEQVCVLAAESLNAARHDVPFALLYLVTADGHQARLASCSGVEPGSRLVPEQLFLHPDLDAPPTWPAAEAIQCSTQIVVSELGMRFGPQVVEPWPEPVSHAVVSPVAATGKGGGAALLITGVNPRRALDDNYRDFLERLAGHIATALANARAYDEERQRVQTLAELDRVSTTFFSNVSHEVAPAYDLSGEVELTSTSRARVLVADDNVDMREYVIRLLRGRYEVEAAPDGAAALSAARHRRPHLVLSDVMMRVMDGFSLLRAFRDDEGLRDIPFVMLSARAGEESRVEGLEAGADDYLVKPFSARELLARVEGTLQLARLRNDTAQQIANLNRELEERLAELQTLLEVIPVGIGVALDPECRHIRANPALARTLGIGPERNASLTASDDERPRSFRVFDDHGQEVPPAQLPMQVSAREGRVVHEIELNVLHDDGRRIRLLEYASPLFDKSGAPRGCVGAFIDITERERIEARNKFLVRLDDAIRPLTEASEITHTAARLLAEQLDVDRCAYADVDDLDDDAFNLTGDYNRGVPSIVGRYRFSSFGQEVLQRMRDNQPYVVDDVLAHEPTITDRAAYEQTQIRAVICVPLHKGGRFAAAMAVHQRTARHWTAGDVELVELVASRCWESIERARVARNLLESEERLRMAVAAARIGYWTWELETELVQLDSTCAELLGMATSQAPPELVLSAIHPDDRSSVDQAVRDAIEGRGPYKVEFRVILPDGETRWLSSRGNGVRVAGRVWRLRGVNMDITEQIQLAEQREQLLESERAARASAERAGRMKDEFLATLSHELRTPLNAVLGYATLMKFAAMNSVEVAEAVDAIERNARLQAQLIEDLLDMNRIMSGKIRLDVQTLSLDEVIKAALDTVLPSAETKGVRIQKVVDPLAGPVRGDPARLQQVVWNLLSNAIKFTPRDGSVQIALERVDSRVEITVSDTGQGITADFLPFVFDRFRQADPSTTRRHGGLGLGLSIVKHLVDLHGGSVRVSSPGEGQGATFVVSLPLAIIHHLEGGNGSRAALAALSASPGHGMNLSGVRVLVVDDEPDATVLVKRILEECQATVTTAHSAQEALEAVRQHPFEVLVSDIGMPGQDGFQLLRAIRSLEGPRSTIPAVALTAFARSEDRRRAALAGFQTHLSKPVEIAELIAVVGNLAGRTKPPADS